MRIFAAVLAIALILLQGRLWFSDKGLREVSVCRPPSRRSAPPTASSPSAIGNWAPKWPNLKTGLAALEERARSELGMVATSETFYQVVRANTPAPVAPAAPVTARAQ